MPLKFSVPAPSLRSAAPLPLITPAKVELTPLPSVVLKRLPLASVSAPDVAPDSAAMASLPAKAIAPSSVTSGSDEPNWPSALVCRLAPPATVKAAEASEPPGARLSVPPFTWVVPL